MCDDTCIYMCNHITRGTFIYYLYKKLQMYVIQIKYVHVENYSSSNSMNSTRIQKGKPPLFQVS